jgi:tetratricopeptide (TPR) repeat protein
VYKASDTLYYPQPGIGIFMQRREISSTYQSSVCHWLPAIAFLLSIPALAQAQTGFYAGQPAAAGDLAVADTQADAPEMAKHQVSPVALEQTGDSLEKGGQYQAAIEVYQQVLKPSAVTWIKMGISYEMLEDLKNAERCYKESLKLQPANPIVLNDLATVQELLQDLPAAERMYRKALEFDPHNAQILKNLGTNLLMQGQFKKGTESYKQALSINPHILDARVGPKVTETAPADALRAANDSKARSCAQAGMTDCAISYLRQAFNEGSVTVKQVNTDADFASLRGTPALAQLIAEQQ